ncbi:hypothetical protein [Methylocapsa sp. S129]|uniref:hypothetical protein n=1 Tax=Methylocapsa sp. S129 TaxID=1641869 RepID=UPI00131C5F39|nr:hypothetical protein [Methylocapsa sp. S129]
MPDATPEAEYKQLVAFAFSTYDIKTSIQPSDFTQSPFGDIAKEIASEGFPFSPLHVEPLLDQAQQLLNRSLQDRKVYSEAAAQAFQIALELEEFARLDQIHEAERLAGAYTIERDRAECDYEAENATSNASQLAADQMRDADKAASSNGETEVALRGFSAFANAGSFMKITNPDGQMNYDLTIGSFSFNGNKPDVAQGIESKLANMELYLRNSGIAAQHNQADGAALASKQREKSAFMNFQFLAATSKTKEDRLAVARDLNSKKMTAVTTQDGPLNYAQLSQMARRRYVANLTKSYQRMVAAASGVSILYGFDDKVPDYELYGKIGEDITDSFLDYCWLWVQTTINRLSAQQRREQNNVVQISVVDLIGHDGFSSFVDSNHWTFDLTSSLFGDASMLRLRGIGASFRTDAKIQAASIWIKPPDNPRYVRDDGTEAQFDGVAGKIIRYGRVLAWNAVRDADVFGIVGLHNWSPIGTWALGFDKKMDVSDIYLDLHLAMMLPT